MSRVFPDRPMTMAFGGTLPPASGAHAELAMRAFDHARRRGLGASIEASRCTPSRSRYLLIDSREGRWVIRISDHVRPEDTGQATPHVDFISRDGIGGAMALLSLVDRIADGEIAWFETGRSRRRRRDKRGRS